MKINEMRKRMLTLSFVIFIVSGFQLASAGTYTIPVPNGDFDNGLAHWTTSGGNYAQIVDEVGQPSIRNFGYIFAAIGLQVECNFLVLSCEQSLFYESGWFYQDDLDISVNRLQFIELDITYIFWPPRVGYDYFLSLVRLFVDIRYTNGLWDYTTCGLPNGVFDRWVHCKIASAELNSNYVIDGILIRGNPTLGAAAYGFDNIVFTKSTTDGDILF